MSLVFIRNHPLKLLNTFGIDIVAQHFCELRELSELPALLDSTAYKSGPLFWLGGGSNVLFTGDFVGLVVHVALKGIQLLAQEADSVLVEAAAGENWHDFVQYTLAQGWYGLENLSLIPGTVGACPIQNIGAYGVEVKDYISAVICADMKRQGQLVTLSNAACCFGYRDSLFKHQAGGQWLVTAVRFRLSRQARRCTDYGDIQQQLNVAGIIQPTPQDISAAIIRIRSSKLPNPAQLGNAGSFFKNPVIDQNCAAALLAKYPGLPHYPAGPGQVKLAAGWLIEQCGLNAYRIGDAGVHERQALVLVNHGRASGEQIYQLASKVRHEVYQRFGVMLEVEPVVL